MATAPPEPPAAAGFSLRGRFLRLLIAPLVVLFALSGFGSYALALHYANTVYDGWLYDSCGSLALLVQRADRGVVLDLPRAAARLFAWDVVDTTYYQVSGARSGLIAGRRDMPAVPAEGSPYHSARLFDGLIDGRPVRIAAVRLPEAEFGEAVTVAVAETKSKRKALARKLLLGVLAPQLTLIGVAGLTLWFGVRGGLAPLDLLARRLQARDHRRLQPIAGDGVPREVQPLTRALNELLARLDSALAGQRRFIADAAHQLRTPLTALKLNIDQALRETSPQAMRQALLESARAVERISRLTNQLLWLARAEPEAAAATPFEKFDLAALAREVGAEWAARALGKHLEMSLECPADPVAMRGNRTLVAEALNNLLDNALKYHPGHGRVLLEVAAAPPRLAVLDDGPGIPPPLRAEALKRFYRMDRKGGEGTGLGLAIVQEIVATHGGRLELGEGLDGRGLAVRIEFPAAG